MCVSVYFVECVSAHLVRGEKSPDEWQRILARCCMLPPNIYPDNIVEYPQLDGSSSTWATDTPLGFSQTPE